MDPPKKNPKKTDPVLGSYEPHSSQPAELLGTNSVLKAKAEKKQRGRAPRLPDKIEK